MRLNCSPPGQTDSTFEADLQVDLYGPAVSGHGRAGALIGDKIRKEKLQPSDHAWDLLSIAMSVIAADLAEPRIKSADGWTRRFNLRIAVSNPSFWNSQQVLIEQLCSFLTTDTWRFEFGPNGFSPSKRSDASFPTEDSVVLLSGGLDSLIGAIDLVANGKRPFAVSHVVRGDAEKQAVFAAEIGGGLRHLQLNHNAEAPNGENPPSQRARSIGFLAYGVLAATTLAQYRDGGRIVLNVCENGFIGINPPLTGARIGSLSTRTTHPIFFALFQRLLNAADLRVDVHNPYRLQTKGEMLIGSKDQALLKKLASLSTSCGRFNHFGNTHCGRCVPCLIRRAAFYRWGVVDGTKYIYKDLSIDSKERRRFDDVWSAMMAIAQVRADGIDPWLSATLSSPLIVDSAQLKAVADRGLTELEAFFASCGMK